MKATCWIPRRTAADRCAYPRRGEDSACDGCALQHVDSEGRTQAQAERQAARQREQAAARARQLRNDYAH